MAVVSREPSLHDPDREAPPDWSVYEDDVATRAVKLAAARSPEVAARMRGAGVAAEDVGDAADLARIPVLSKDDLPDLQAQSPPFAGMLAVPLASLRRIYRSPGPIHDPEGDVDDFWRVAPAAWAAGFREGDVVLNTFSYHLTPGGHMLDAGFRHLGCVVVPGGVGNTAGQVETAVATGATGYGGTPQFLLTLLEHARETGLTHRLERALVTGAPLPPDLREVLEKKHQIDVYQCYGTADAGIVGYECHLKSGWHVGPDVVVQVVDPATGAVVEDGAEGEVVVTSPNAVYPLVRFGTGDLSAFASEPCPCGRTSPRLVGFLGRVGEGVKVRGMFVHPRQLGRAFAGDRAVARYQGVVSRSGTRDELTVLVEPVAGAEVDPEAVAARVRDAVQLRAEVRVVEPGTIEEDARPVTDRRDP